MSLNIGFKNVILQIYKFLQNVEEKKFDYQRCKLLKVGHIVIICLKY